MHGPLIVEEVPDDSKIQEAIANRYDVSIFDTPFAKLPDPKRVWLGAPSSHLEGLGMHLIH